METIKPGRKGLPLLYVLALSVVAGLISSCASTRPFTYMQGQFDTAKLSQIPVTEQVIQKADLLSIIVYSDNPQATALYNQPIIGAAGSSGGSAGSAGTGSTAGAGSSTGGAPSSGGYLVDERGNIAFEGLGFLHVEGLTRSQLNDTLNARLGSYFTNPYFIIRFLNNRFTMLGEVSKPGMYTIPGERLNILEAIGMAGDLTFYGRRDNVLIVRENNGKREFARLDLTKPEIMGSPYFYLQQNDMVIVEQNRKKAVANDQVATRNITIAATIISTLAIVYSILK
jgi:polysaccharide export outer membrane protein